MKRLRWSVFWLGLALWVVLPVGLFLMVAREGGQTRITEPAQTWVPVEQTTSEVARNVGVLMKWESPGVMVAPEWNGIVQRVSTGPGEPLASGNTVATIGGIDRLAIHTPVPFSRQLTQGDTGGEVQQLNQMLADRGLPHSDGESYTAETATGVARFAASLGVPAQERTSFNPAWVVYLPAASTVLDSVELTVAAPAPAAGTVIGTPRAQLVAAEISTPEAAEAVEREATTEDQGQVNSSSTSSSVRGEPVEAAPGERLLVGSTELAIGRPRHTVADEALDALQAQVVPGSPSTTGRLMRPAGLDEFVVPAAAIFAGDGGRLCVLASPAGDDDAAAVPVSTVGSEDGRTVVTGDLSRDQQVLLAVPGQLRQCE